MPGALRKLIAEDSDDPVLAAFLSAPTDERPETDEERAAVEAAKAAFPPTGQGVRHAEVVAALGRRHSAG